MNVKSTRGGKRLNSGRKPRTEPAITFSCKIPASLFARLKAVKTGLTYSSLLARLLDALDAQSDCK